MSEEIKRIRLRIDDLDGASLDRISWVSEPAIERDFWAFSKEKKEMRFKVESEEQRKITGPAMIANLDIPRLDPNTGEEFMVYFTEEDIIDAQLSFFKNSDVNSTNLEHEFDIEGVTLVESWIVDNKNGKGGGENFEDMKDGDWMVTWKVSEDIWQEFIKSGVIKGFSIEGIFIQEFMKQKFGVDYTNQYNDIIKILRTSATDEVKYMKIDELLTKSN